jgi:alpha-methylacyl-CoA racemase
MGPLTGFKVIEMAAIGPAPLAGMLLADMGAEVIRIDRLGESDLGIKRDARFELASRGKRSVAVDIKSPLGRDAVLRFVRGADALIEGFRPGVMERLGLGPKDCHAVNPGLVFGRITGWGQQGPLAQSAAHDMNYIALAGALDAIGLADGPPVAPLNLVGDFGGGSTFLVMGVLAALLERSRSGRGQVVDAAIVDGVGALMAGVHGQIAGGIWRQERGEHVVGGAAPWNTVYRTSDGGYITVCAIEQRFFAELLRRLEIDPASVPNRMDRANWPPLRSRFEAIFASETREHWCQMLEGTDSCFAPVLHASEAPEHPHNIARGAFIEVDGVRQPAPAPRFDRTPGAVRGSMISRPGQHSDALLRESGFSEEEIADLREAGVVGD